MYVCMYAGMWTMLSILSTDLSSTRHIECIQRVPNVLLKVSLRIPNVYLTIQACREVGEHLRTRDSVSGWGKERERERERERE
jgi:hypothetical protein